MKKAALILIIFIAAISCQAQDTIIHRPSDPQRTEVPSLKDRIFTGGDLGLQFGDVTLIYLAPIVGYKLTQKLGAGFGPSYTYLKDKRHYYSNEDYTASSYGGRVFGQYQVIEHAIAYAEYSLINSDVIDEFTFRQKRVNISALLLGGGYSQPIGNSYAFNIMVLFDVIQDRYSYTENPIIRAGFNIGF